MKKEGRGKNKIKKYIERIFKCLKCEFFQNLKQIYENFICKLN